MGNDLTKNPLFFDTTSTAPAWGISKRVRLIQWIDDAADITHDSILTLVINGLSITAKIQPLANESAFGAVAWQMGPFNPGISMILNVGAMAHGHLHVWIN